MIPVLDTRYFDEKAVRQVFAETFSLAPASVVPDMTPETVEKWDSFGHMRLITAVEARFGIKLEMSQIMTIDSYSTLCRIISEANTTSKSERCSSGAS